MRWLSSSWCRVPLLFLPLLPLLLLVRGGLWGLGAQSTASVPPPYDVPPPPTLSVYPYLVRGTFKGTWTAQHTDLNLVRAFAHATVQRRFRCSSRRRSSTRWVCLGLGFAGLRAGPS